MDGETYESMPKTLTVRELRKHVDTPGFRVKKLDVITTLLDADEYSAEEVTDLYHERWHVELDIRSIKSALSPRTFVIAPSSSALSAGTTSVIPQAFRKRRPITPRRWMEISKA